MKDKFLKGDRVRLRFPTEDKFARQTPSLVNNKIYTVSQAYTSPRLEILMVEGVDMFLPFNWATQEELCIRSIN